MRSTRRSSQVTVRPTKRKNRRTGWAAKIRTKVSKHAAQGYLFEVKLVRVWVHKKKGSLSEVLSCLSSHRLLTQVSRNRQQATILLHNEADLLLLRMAELDGVFRIYRLVEEK